MSQTTSCLEDTNYAVIDGLGSLLGFTARVHVRKYFLKAIEVGAKYPSKRGLLGCSD